MPAEGSPISPGPRSPASAAGTTPQPQTWQKVRHDIRNLLNAIKLSCAVLRRKPGEEMGDELLREIEHSADGINEMITNYRDPGAPGT